MALKKPLVLNSGQNQQLQSTDALDYFKASSVAFSGTISLDTDSADLFNVGTMTSNPTIGFVGTRPRAIVRLTQDATGNRTVTWDSSVTYLAGLGSIQINPVANTQTLLTFLYNSVTAKYDIVAGSYSTAPSGTTTFGQATIDFGTANDDTVTLSVVDTGVTGGSIIVPSLGGPAAGRDADEMELVDIRLSIGTVSAGVGFDIIATCFDADANGQYLVNYSRS
jgi:hypothetical protein